MRTNEVKNKIKKNKIGKKKIKIKNLKHETKKYTYDFQQYETTKSLSEGISNKARIVEAEKGQNNLLKIYRI